MNYNKTLDVFILIRILRLKEQKRVVSVCSSQNTAKNLRVFVLSRIRRYNLYKKLCGFRDIQRLDGGGDKYAMEGRGNLCYIHMLFNLSTNLFLVLIIISINITPSNIVTIISNYLHKKLVFDNTILSVY